MEEEKSASLENRATEVVTRFAGSVVFVYLHLVVFGVWVLAGTASSQGSASGRHT